MTMYLLSNTSIINALIAQKTAGHDVKVILNQTFPGGTGSNDAVFAQLQAAGVAVHWAPTTFTLTHEKCVIIDGTTSWIMTMNVTASSPTSNREYLAIDTNAPDVAESEAIFQADWNAVTPTLTGTLLVAPVNARPPMTTAIDGATTTVDMEAEELSDTSIVNSLVAARGRGVRVHVVLSDATASPAQMTAVTQLKTAGANLVTLHNPYVHAKSFVVDGKGAYIGSENFTSSSLSHNRELGVMFTSPSEVQKVINTTAADFAAGTPL
jgi:phosphatidylserine/phosphatidylglycerophosphate/cardiolipin synthase-like enzyme